MAIYPVTPVPDGSTVRRLEAYDVLVYTEGGHYYAKDLRGDLICVDSPTACLQEAVNYVAQLGGGKILVKKGTYYPKKTIIIPDGINLVIDGEGNNTVFRYTNQMYLFRHVPPNSTWTSVIIFRNFKVDRTGSGSNNWDIIAVNYAKYVMFDGIEIIDDFRVSNGDAGIVGYNNIVAVAQNCRIFNKSYGIWLGAFLGVARNNYINNTAQVGIGLFGLNEGFTLPPGYSYGGLSIVEDNVAVDCGQTDECLAVDYGPVTRSYGIGIIRNNLVMTVNNPSYVMIAGNADKFIIENNDMEGPAKASAVVMWGYRATQAIVKNNRFNITYINVTSPLIVSNYQMLVLENNSMSVAYNNISANIEDVLHLLDIKAFVKNNSIRASVPAGYIVNNFIRFNVDSSDINPGYTMVESNELFIDSSVNNLIGVFLVGNYSTSKPQIIVSKNLINASSTVNKLLYITIYGNLAYAFVRDNQLNANVANVVGATTNQSGVAVYLDTDTGTLFRPDATMSYYYYRKNSGMVKFSGDGTTTQFKIAHGLANAPSRALVTPASKDAASSFYVTTDNTYIYVNYTTAPPAGTDNVVLYWYAEV